MKKLISTVAIAALVLIALARLCLYTVGEREYALVFALGELKDVKTIPGTSNYPHRFKTSFT